MRIGALSDVFKIVVYIAMSFLLAAVITPPIFEIGKGFANVFTNKDTADEVAWLAGKAGKADFDTFFKRSLMLSAVIWLFPLFYFLNLRADPRRMQSTPWSIYLSPKISEARTGQALRLWTPRFGFLHLFSGFTIAAVFFLIMSCILYAMGWFTWASPPTQEVIFKALKRSLKAALVAPVLEEILFRGALLGVFLRAFRPSVAIFWLSLLFAAVHFLQPPPNSMVSDPKAATAGFEMLSLIGHRFLEPQAMIYGFASLFAVGIILGVARYGTASLWLPIGLHAGWVFSVKTFNRLTERRADFPENYELYMGNNLREGIFPLVTLALTGFFVVFYLKKTCAKKEPEL